MKRKVTTSKGSRTDFLLGMDGNITRRDFLNASLLGAGAALLSAPAPWAVAAAGSGRTFPPTPRLGPAWYGYGGTGDYRKSHGNTPDAVTTAHAMRDGRFDEVTDDWRDTGETYDLVVVGAGFAGLGAAFEYHKQAGTNANCLILDNHPVFGGEAKQNEFLVNGVHLYGPQGSNGFSIPGPAAAGTDDYESGDAVFYSELGMPRSYSYAAQTGGNPELRFGHDNYGFMYWLQDRIDVSYFYDQASYSVPARHVLNQWSSDLRDTPLDDRTRRALVEWSRTRKVPYSGKDYRCWLDTMTYKDYLEKELKLDPAATRYADPIVASAVGLGSDVISAFSVFNIGLPGFKGYAEISVDNRHSFPGGNAGFLRHFVKRIKPEAIAGRDEFADILNRHIRFDELDKPGQRFRMRLGVTVVHVRHDHDDPGQSRHVWISYVRNGKVYRVRARALVMGSGSWVNKHVVRDLPSEYTAAFNTFHHAPILVANVALTNWRFLEKLGATATIYRGGFGYFCNVRRPMWVADYRPPLDPDQPTVLTFYVPFFYPGHAMAEQGLMGRMEMLTTSFADYERKIREQLVRLYGNYGFDPKRDIAAIILNRWGHAYVTPQPGFYFGRNGEPAPREVISRRYGRIAFAHSELRGNQHWGPAAMEGRRAARQVADLF